MLIGNLSKWCTRRAVWSPIALFLTINIGSLAQSPPSFITHRDYIAADSARLFAQADLNGDGIADLVVPGATVNFTTLSVLLGKADGSFQPPAFFDTGDFDPSAVVIADFNGDGKKDVAVTTLSAVSVLLGDGLGNFGAPRLFAVGSNPVALVAGDFDGDRKADLAVANFVSNTVSVLLNNGHGGFDLSASLTVGRGPLGVITGDFNRDGRTDLAVTNSNQGGGTVGPNGNTISILLGTGRGSFSPAVNIPVAKDPVGIAVSDLNHDSKQDVVVTNGGADQVSVLLGNGDGSFVPPATFTVASGGKPPIGFNPTYVAVDDFNHDNNLDLAVVNSNTSTVAILLGDGTGKFGSPLNTSVGRTPVAVLTGDFNHDGKRDFITSNIDGATVSVVFGKGNGSFVMESNFACGTGVSEIVAADFNRDGLQDVATVNSGNSQDGHTVSVLLGKPGGQFGAAKTFNAGTDPLSLAVGDFNGDGNLDLVTANFGTFPNDHGNVSLLLGNGDGTFQSARNFTAGDFPDSIAVGNFNGDGKLDIAVGNFATNVGVASVSILLGDGKGGFAPAVNIKPQVENVFQVVTADFNRDGKVDIAFSSRTFNDDVSVMLGNGDGSFQSAVTATSSFLVFTFAVGDLNRDGVPDLAIEEGGVVELLLGDGHGGFQSQGTFNEGEGATFSAVQSLAIADFNGDGFADIAAPDVFSDNVSIMSGNGDGTVGPGRLFGGGPGGRAVAIDLNRDRRIDLILAATNISNNSSGKVIVLLNNTLR